MLWRRTLIEEHTERKNLMDSGSYSRWRGGTARRWYEDMPLHIAALSHADIRMEERVPARRIYGQEQEQSRVGMST
jgi:hypothetical protein